jgi:phosphoenolpyruvate synthase/pyruvate phosphate dikinase
MLSVKRNRLLLDMAAQIKERPELLKEVRTGQVTDPGLLPAWQAFLQEFGDLACGSSTCTLEPEALANLIREMAARPIQAERFTPQDAESLKEQFLARFTGPKQTEMAEYLDLARASYRLRDDDNLHLGKIKAQFLKAAAEFQRRQGEERELPGEVQALFAELEEKPQPEQAALAWRGFSPLKARQLVGQPASPGLAKGPARVVLEASELFHFKTGDVLVCDAVDPSMTFVAPLAAGIVERRGGMLIHGSIIAREYGIPCVTGVPQATALIHPGDPVTVDGYLGIVIIG